MASSSALNGTQAATGPNGSDCMIRASSGGATITVGAKKWPMSPMRSPPTPTPPPRAPPFLSVKKDGGGKNPPPPRVGELQGGQHGGGALDVGVVADDHRRVPAQFHRDALHVAAGQPPPLPSPPHTTLSTPGGRPASWNRRAMATTALGESSGPLMMIVQPAATAAAILRMA